MVNVIFEVARAYGDEGGGVFNLRARVRHSYERDVFAVGNNFREGHIFSAPDFLLSKPVPKAL